MRAHVETADWLVLLGAAAVGCGAWFLAGWPGVLMWTGLCLILVGVGEARRGKR